MKLTRLTVASASLAAVAGGLVAPLAATTATAAAPAPTAQYQVTLQISAKAATAREDAVKLSGTVLPRPPADSRVVLQVQYENQTTWKKAGAAPVTKSGTFTFVEKPESHLDRVYRVVKAADDKASADKSRERGLHVIGWQWLSKLVPSAANGVVKADKMPINGDTYSHTLFDPVYQPTAFTEFTLGRKCLTLEATFGLSDRTETGGQAGIFVNTDGTLAYARAFELGQSELRRIDVTDVYRVRMDFRQTTGTPATEPAAGAARVLCD